MSLPPSVANSALPRRHVSRAPQPRDARLWTDPVLDPFESLPLLTATLASPTAPVPAPASSNPATRSSVGVGKGKGTPRVVPNVGSAASSIVQIYSTPNTSDKADIVFTFCFAGGTEINGSGYIYPLDAAAGPISASLSDTSNEGAAPATWTAAMTALQQGSAPRCFTAIGAPAQDMEWSFDGAGGVRFSNMPAPLPTSGTLADNGFMQYLYVQVAGVPKAPLLAYFGNVVAGGYVFSDLSFRLEESGSVFATSGVTKLVPDSPDAMFAFSTTNADASVACPAYAPFRRGVCELSPDSIVPLRPGGGGDSSPSNSSGASLPLIASAVFAVVVFSVIVYMSWKKQQKLGLGPSGSSPASSDSASDEIA